MGIKGLLSGLGMDGLAVPALVLCFCSFLAILVRTWTRPRKEIDAQSRLPLDEDD